MSTTKSGADMLINVRASLDKIEGFRNESFEPEEIQLYANKSQLRLLDALVNKNFQQGTLRYDWLRPFMTSSLSPVSFAGTAKRVEVAYPTGLYYRISAHGNVVLSTTNFSPNGTSDKCLDTIADPSSVVNPIETVEQIDILETGTTTKKEHNVF